MRRSLWATAVVCALTIMAAAAGSATAALVTVLGPGHRVGTVDNPYLAPANAAVFGSARRTDGSPTGGAGLSGQPTTTTSTGTTPTTTTTAPTATSTTPTTPTRTSTTPTKTTPPGKAAPQPTVVSVLAQLARGNQITAAQHSQYLSQWNAALADEKHLKGTRLAQLTAVTETLHQIAADGQLTPSRLPAVFLTLARNVQWWTKGPLLQADQRVQFNGSAMIWEYYPGEGIQLQPLATFGEANGMYTAGPAQYPAMVTLLNQILPLAAAQGSGITFDYYFPFDGGLPPWSSAMTDGTALEALARAYIATRDNQYLLDGAEILPVLEAAPPIGLSLRTSRGRRFLQYSFAPKTDIINAFLQTLIGLFYFSHISGNLLALQLFNAGNAQAQSELPSFNTGAWSLYQPGLEDTLSYHELVTGFLQNLCALTQTPVYCQTASDFQADLKTAPVLTQLTATAKPKKSFGLRFKLSKVSKVGLVLLNGSKTAFQTSAGYGFGTDSIKVPALTAGSYAVHLSATDLAGNFSRIAGTLQVGS